MNDQFNCNDFSKTVESRKHDFKKKDIELKKDTAIILFKHVIFYQINIELNARSSVLNWIYFSFNV